MFAKLNNLKARTAISCGLAAAILATIIACSTQSPDATPSAIVPPLMLPYGSGWSGGAERGNGGNVPAEDFVPADFLEGPEHIQAAILRGIPPDKVGLYLKIRMAGQQFIPPASGIGPILDDPEHPYFSNSMERNHVGRGSTPRVADLNNAAAKNLKPWVFEALQKQNALVLAGKNFEPRVQRCWELGIPGFDEIRHPLYIIQTPDEIVMYMGKYVRHIYMNVPHSKNLEPSWYGESVGHYEGDTLVVDTIGQNDKTLVDSYRTPHTSQIHVVERFRVIASGRGLDTSISVDDPGAFSKPWGARRPRYFLAGRSLNEMDRICAPGNEDVFDIGLEPMQKALTPDF